MNIPQHYLFVCTILLSLLAAVVALVLASKGNLASSKQDNGGDYAQHIALPISPPSLQPDWNHSHNRGAAPSNAERRAMATDVLNILHENITRGQLNYRFNPSGEAVVLGTAGLAFIASGSTLHSGPYREALQAIQRRLQGIMDRQQFEFQPVWGCSQSLIFLAELHRTANPQAQSAIRPLMQAYARKLIDSQTPEGGWCHTFENVPNQLGYTHLVATAVMALKGLGMAQREGVSVPATVFERGVSYLEESSSSRNGQIGYSPRSGQRGMAGPGRTAGGLLALMAIGQHQHPLVEPASRYLISTFSKHDGRPTETLQGGHASAQMGLAWAAWWAGRNQQYEAFWAEQGPVIAARRQPDGSFLAAPSDGRQGQAPAHEAGDYANAWHALTLLGDSRYLQIDSYGSATLRLLGSISAAQQLVAAWPGSQAPQPLRDLAALADAQTLPEPQIIVQYLRGFERELRGFDHVESIPLLKELFHIEVSTRALLDPRGSRIAVVLEAPEAFSDRLASAMVTISIPDMANGPRPVRRSLRPNTRQATENAIMLSLPRGAQAPESVQVDIEWTVLGMQFEERRTVAITPVEE